MSGRTRRLPGTANRLHQVVLRGLEPAAEYLYRVGPAPASGAEPEWRRVRTAPAARSASYDAVFLCDVGIGGRADGTTRDVAAVLRELGREPPLFYLGGGDYAYARRDARFADPAEAIDRWLEQMEPLFACAPLMAQYGNHEVELGEDVGEWAARFAHPRGSRDGLCFSFDVGPAHFVSLYAPGRPPSAAHLRWLEADLASEAARRAAWRIVFQHAPIFASGSSHPARGDVAALRGRFERLGVDLHLSGHDQSYERTHPLGADGIAEPFGSAAGRARYRAGRGVVYAKVSPAGKLSERGLGFSRLEGPARDEIAARCDRSHHWARLRVSEQVLEVEVAGLASDAGTLSGVDAFSLERLSDSLSPRPR